MDDDLATVRIGALGGDSISVVARGRRYPEATDLGDGNWIETTISFTLGQFDGAVSATLRSDEFAEFRR
jgi:hypothetical protein